MAVLIIWQGSGRIKVDSPYRLVAFICGRDSDINVCFINMVYKDLIVRLP